MVNSTYSLTESDPLANPLADRLATQIFDVALKHGLRGNFLQAQLDVWNTVRRVLAEESPAPLAFASIGSSRPHWVDWHS